ncbi:Hypothetical protein D9617_1g084340 [Elsinoe fawcettii]|nr:Hypothetical protein D9617_1g084340 [Elsinoe fawcettii]
MAFLILSLLTCLAVQVHSGVVLDRQAPAPPPPQGSAVTAISIESGLLRLTGTVKGSGNVWSAGYYDWATKARCSTAGAREGLDCVRKAMLEGIPHAVSETLKEGPGRDFATIDYIGEDNHGTTYTLQNRGQGPSRPQGSNTVQTPCPDYVLPFLPSGSAFKFGDSRSLWITCKNTCSTTTLNWNRMQDLISQLPEKMLDNGAFEAQFEIWRDTINPPSKTVYSRCKIAFQQSTWLPKQSPAARMCPDFVEGTRCDAGDPQ